MKVLIQWATATAQDWYEYDIRNNGDARSLFKKKKPLGNDVIDDEPGWISAINVQGVIFDGFDHVALEYFNGAVVVTSWVDDDEDTPEDEHYGQQWVFQDPAPDPRIDGRVNTRQSMTWFAPPGGRVSKLLAEHKPLTELPKPPDSQTLHGVWLSDDLFEAHREARSHRGWREWA